MAKKTKSAPVLSTAHQAAVDLMGPLPAKLDARKRKPLTEADRACLAKLQRAAGIGVAEKRIPFAKPKGMSLEEWEHHVAAADATKNAQRDERLAALRERAKERAAKKPGRPPRQQTPPDAKIMIVAQKNPYREGSMGHAVFARYKPRQTVAAFLLSIADLVGKRRPIDMLMFDLKRGHIQLSSEEISKKGRGE